MIRFAEAQEIVVSHLPAPRFEYVGLEQACGCVLAEDVLALADSPRFDCSSVDGFAIAVNGGPPVHEFVLGETIAAGAPSSTRLPLGCAARILTGAVVPEGSNAVVMNEACRECNDRVYMDTVPCPGDNIRRRGEEYQRGDLILQFGAKLNPAAIGTLAFNGITTARVFSRPRVVLITTGSEIVEPGATLRAGQNYNANRWSLVAALRSLDVTPAAIQHVRDDKAEVLAVLEAASASADIMITTGGVSVGMTDYLRPVMQELGWNIRFDQVAIKPGKPTCFGTRGQQLWFGLPGNPLAAQISFQHFVRPTIRKLTRQTDDSLRLQPAALTHPLSKRPGRLEFVRGMAWDEGEVLLVKPHSHRESHMLSSLVTSNCLIHFPEEAEHLPAGECVEIEFLTW